jgi:S1-C subfamily serine protease
MLGITGVYVEGGAYYLPTADGVQLIFEDELKDYSMDELIHPAVSGIYVMGFADGMDAASKMQIGDIITAAEGEDLKSMNQLMNIINEFYAGDTVTLTVYRDSTNVSVDIVLSAKPEQ